MHDIPFQQLLGIVSVGHAELMITWPSRSVDGGKIHQHTTDYWNNQQTPPKDVWGFVA